MLLKAVGTKYVLLSLENQLVRDAVPNESMSLGRLN